MSVDVYQKIGQTFTTGTNGTGQMPYFVRGTQDKNAAYTAIYDNVEAVPGFSIASIQVTELYAGSGTDGYWEGIVNYVAIGLAVFDVGDSTFSFSTQGGTTKIKSSLGTRGVYDGTGASSTATFAGAIGVQMRNGEIEVEGAEIDTSDFNFEETHVFADSQVTPTFLRTLYFLSGCVNSVAVATQKMGSFAPGELKFKYAAGTKDGSGNWKITFYFHGSPNLPKFPIGTLIVNGAKNGHDYVWVQYKPVEDTTNKTLLPGINYVVVDKVCIETNLLALTVLSPIGSGGGDVGTPPPYPWL